MKQELTTKKAPVRTIQQAKKQPAKDTSLRASILSETLREDQVHLRPITGSLPVNELAQLLSGLKGRGNPANQAIIESLSNGRATQEGHYVQLNMPDVGHHSGRAIADGIAAIHPKETSVKIAGDQYEVRAHVNPWIQVARGRITAVDTTTHWHSSKPGWEFHTWNELSGAGIDRSQPMVGQAFPAVTNPYTVPSATYNPAAQTPSFHTLPVTSLPAVPFGYSWTGGGGPATPYVPVRDPVARPASPGFDVDSDTIGGRTTYTSFERDPASTSGVRVLSGYAEVALRGNTYTGKRNYPMTSADFSGWGRGHVVDHADGDEKRTSSASNFVPQDKHWNEGARNHLAQGMRDGGGACQVVYDYDPTPSRTTDGTAVPTTEHFQVTPQGGTPSYFAVPNTAYPADRTTAAAYPFLQTTPFPIPPYY